MDDHMIGHKVTTTGQYSIQIDLTDSQQAENTHALGLRDLADSMMAPVKIGSAPKIEGSNWKLLTDCCFEALTEAHLV